MQTNYETFFFVTLSFYEILMNFVLTLYSSFYLAQEYTYIKHIYTKYAYMPYIKFIYFLIIFENNIYNFLVYYLLIILFVLKRIK